MRSILALLACALALLASGCIGGESGAGGGGGGTLVWGIASEPVALDPALAPDIESRRVQAQIFEGLVALRPGTTEVVPGLAERWEASADARMWTFTLRDGVTFHDGTPLTASAVCFNFARWHRFRGSLRSLQASYYWQRAFEGFAGQPGLFAGCAARDERTVALSLTRPDAAFLASLAMPAFGIASPQALERYDADAGSVDPQRGFVPAGTFATDHPIGTGPFVFRSWARGDRLVLERNTEYWGEGANLDTVVFRLIPAANERLAALERNEIQGFDLLAPQDVGAVRRNPALAVLDRPAFNLGYLTINQARPPLGDVRVREAVAYGLDRRALAAAFSGGRADVATQFLPPETSGYATDVERYEYDPGRARRLLVEAGLTLPVRLEFWYPIGVSRPYLPEPTRAFSILASGLERAGFKVIAKSAAWGGDYLTRVDRGRAGDVNLVGWTGDAPDASNFLGTIFAGPSAQFGYRDGELFALLARARRDPDRTARAELYAQANRKLMRDLPAVPLVYAREALALRREVTGYISSPLALEPLAAISLGG